MQNVKLIAIASILAMETAAMVLNLNGETLIYAIGAIAGLGGLETWQSLKTAK